MTTSEYVGGQLLKQLRERAGMSRLELEQQASIGVNNLAKYESGQRTTPRKQTIVKILDALDVGFVDRKEVLEAFGYSTGTSLPTEKEIATAIEIFNAEASNLQQPAFLVDIRGYIFAWNQHIPELLGVNEEHLQFFSQRLTLYQTLFHERLRLADYIMNHEVLQAVIQVYKQESVQYRKELWFETLLDKTIKMYPEFSRYWAQSTDTFIQGKTVSSPLLIQWLSPILGRSTFHFSQEKLGKDERFYKVFLLRVDEQVLKPNKVEATQLSNKTTGNYLVFHDNLINNLCRRLTINDVENRILFLQGPPGMGKSKIAYKVATELKKQKTENNVIFYSIDHVVKQDDVSDALNSYIAYLSSCFNIPTTESITSQRSKIEESIKKYNSHLVLIVDGLRNEIKDVFVRFLESLPESVKILITLTTGINCQPQRQIYETIELPGIEKSQIYDFLRIGGLKIEPSEEDIEKIHQGTAGNSFALRKLIRSLKENPNQKLDDILKVTTVRDGNIAHQWVEKTFEDLSADEKLLLKAHSLFRDSVDQRILIKIAWSDIKETKLLAEGERKLHQLCMMRILSPDKKAGRFRMEEPYRTYVRNKIENNPKQRKEWKDKWVKCYANLRPRDDNFHDKAGWTIFTDYFPDEDVQINYADEIETIVDVIKYCMSEKRLDDYWKIAADLLDDFRAVLFATGRWYQRIELCEQVLAEADHREQDYIVGRLKRMLAWMYCFQDDYKKSKDFAYKARKIAYNGIQNKLSSVKERIIYRQTYYKSLNTLGQIALRQGQDAAIRLQIAHRQYPDVKESELNYATALEDKKQLYLQEVRERLKEARDYFLQADGFVGAEFPLEAIITDFHIAEVDYYHRHTYTLSSEKDYLQKSLEESLNAFHKILATAKDREHERLKTYTHYYLGKIYRRLTRHKDSESKAEYFDKAFEHLQESLSLARKFSDSVLEARIKFALCQWYEGYCEENSAILIETEKHEKIKKGKELGLQAAKELQRLGMKLECADAVAFLQRLRKTDIPTDLLEDFNTRYGDI